VAEVGGADDSRRDARDKSNVMVRFHRFIPFSFA
jgi:hypothetical protein